MKYLIAFLVATVLVISQISVTAQENNTEITADNSTDVTTDATAIEEANTTESTTNTTTTEETTEVTTTNNTTTNVTESTVVVSTPLLSDTCMEVVYNCTSKLVVDMTVCASLESQLQGCLGTGDNADNETMTCADEDYEQLNQFCFGVRLLELSMNAQVSESCQARAVEVVDDNDYTVEDITVESGAYCTFLDVYETDLQAEEESLVCSSDEYTQLHEAICFACRGTVASLALVLAMVLAQWVF